MNFIAKKNIIYSVINIKLLGALKLKYIIIKLSNKRNKKFEPIPFGNANKLKERASGPWRTSLNTLYATDHALALYQGRIIAEYRLRASVQIDRRQHRLFFNMDTVSDSPYIGKRLDYPTANPVSILDSNDFVYKK